MSLGSVVWTSTIDDEGAPGEALEVLQRDAEVVYAAVEAADIPAGTTVTATWTMSDQPIEGKDATVTIADAAASGWLSFSLAWNGETRWPSGTLGVTITSSTGATAKGSLPIGPG